jgi:two-component system, OmpR family, sensor histidine kinase SenX3
MNITRRRGAIAFFITFGCLLVGVLITLNIGWILLNERTVAFAVLGIILFAILIAGVVLNTVFLVREIRRNERQDSFLNAVTHELKTPIASIRLYLETLQRRPVDEAQRQQFYANMLSDSDRLLGTVEQVLKAGQLGQRHRQQNRVLIDFGSLIEDCIAITLQRHHLPSEAIVLEPVPGAVRLQVLGIAEDLRTALLNVLDNAVKYSPEGVHVRCSLAITRYTLVTLRITDTGLGLPANQYKRIFNRFYRVPGRYTVKIKGTGLGLFLVRNIVRQHGGDVSAESPGPNKGTTIVLTLPLAGSGVSSISTASSSATV